MLVLGAGAHEGPEGEVAKTRGELRVLVVLHVYVDLKEKNIQLLLPTKVDLFGNSRKLQFGTSKL